jgi:hypothetical protein
MRRLPALLLALLTLTFGSPSLAAQEATPMGSDSILAVMGYPEFRVRVTGIDYEMSATSIPAGRTLIVLENAGEESWHGFLLRLPEGMTADSAMRATPGPEGAPPPWLFESYYPGFPGETQPGQTNYAVVDLAPGDYVIVSDSFQPFVVTANDASPTMMPEPAADGTVRLFEYGFQFPDALTPGRQVWTVTNAGREPHELILVRSPEPITREQALELIMAESQDATPTGGGPSAREFVAVGGMGWLSPGQTAWTEVDLEPGTYVVLCYAVGPDLEPHVLKGMVDVLTVGRGHPDIEDTPAF